MSVKRIPRMEWISVKDRLPEDGQMIAAISEEIDSLMKFRIKSNDFETGWTRDERYILNKIRSDHINKILEKEFTVKFERKHPPYDKNDKSFYPPKPCCEGTENLKSDHKCSQHIQNVIDVENNET